MSRYGRVHEPEPLSSLSRLHFHTGGALRAIAYDPTIPVLDQENLIAQGIDTSLLIPGARKVNALGSCVANATTAALSALLSPYTLAQLGLTSDAADVEQFAITLYHGITSQPGSAAEWPPTDHGTSGLAACTYLERQQVITGHHIAHDAQGIVSLMQHSGLIVGQPYLNVWEEPGPDHFIDGDGSVATLQEQLRRGVAGGHETYWAAVEQVGFDEHGRVDPFRTIIRFRQSWGLSWGDQGNAYAHLSSFVALGRWCDFRALTP